MSIKNEIARTFGHFYDAYIERWHEQGLTGKLSLTVNFYKGGLASSRFEDIETKTVDELREVKKFSA